MSVFESASDNRESAVAKALSDRKWEEVQVKVFTQWLNGYLAEANTSVEDVVHDLDGVRLCVFVELLSEKRIKQRWNKNPRNNMQKRENLTIALEHISSFVRLVGVGSEDFESNNKKMILGFLWTLYKHFRLEKALAATGEKGTMEEGLLNWVRKTTDGYRDVEIKNYRHSFNDGMAFLALVDKYVDSDKSVVDYDQFTKADARQNLEAAFKLGAEKLNIPQLLDVQEVIDGDIDERTMVLYTSLFFQAFVAKEKSAETDEERRRRSEEAARLDAEREAATKNADQLAIDNEEMRRRLEEQERRLQEQEDKIRLLQGQLDSSKQHEAQLEGQIGELEGSVELFQNEKKSREQRMAVELKGLAVLKENLVQHMEDLHRWEGLILPGGTSSAIDLSGTIRSEVLSQITDSNFDEQLDELATRLSKENEELEAKLKVAEAENSVANAHSNAAKKGTSNSKKGEPEVEKADKPSRGSNEKKGKKSKR